MSKDSSFLYTGSQANSSSSERLAKRAEKKRAESEQRAAIRSQLRPAAEIIFGMIESEKSTIMSITSIDTSVDSDELALELRARKRYITYLNNLKTLFERALREPTTEDDADMPDGWRR